MGRIDRHADPGHMRAMTKTISWGAHVELPGASASPPGNSLPLIEAARSMGYDGFELDMRFTRDRRIVLAHDPVVKSPFGEIKLPDCDLSEATQFKLGEWDGKPVGLISAVQAFRAANGHFVLADLRADESDIIRLADTVEESGFDPTRLMVSAYSPKNAQIILENIEGAAAYIKIYKPLPEITEEFLDQAAEAGATGVMVVCPIAGEDVSEHVHRAHSRGLKLILFVHGGWPRHEPPGDRAKSAQHIVDCGVDFALTKSPALFARCSR